MDITVQTGVMDGNLRIQQHTITLLEIIVLQHWQVIPGNIIMAIQVI